MANRTPAPESDNQPDVIPGLKTLLGWAARHPTAPLMGICAAAAIVVLAVQRFSGPEALVGVLLGIAALVSFIWAMWLLHNYRAAPRPAKLLAWCICLSGGLVFLAGAIKIAMNLLGIECIPPFCKVPVPVPVPVPVETECEGGAWAPLNDYNKLIFDERKKQGLYPAKLYGREKSRDVYEVCAVWTPAPANFASYSWLTPTEFAQQQMKRRGWRVTSMNVVHLQNGEFAIQVTWIKP